GCSEDGHVDVRGQNPEVDRLVAKLAVQAEIIREEVADYATRAPEVQTFRVAEWHAEANLATVKLSVEREAVKIGLPFGTGRPARNIDGKRHVHVVSVERHEAAEREGIRITPKYVRGRTVACQAKIK